MTAPRQPQPPPRRMWGPLAAVTVGVSFQRGLGALLPMVLAVIATRSGGFDAAAIVGVSVASAILVGTAIDFGMTPSAVRDFARAAPGRSEMYWLLRVKFAIGCVAAAVLAGIAYTMGSETWSVPLMVAALAIPQFTVTMLLTSKHTVDGDGSILALSATFGFIAGVITALAGAALSDDPAMLLAAFAVARGVEVILLVAGLRLPSFASRGAYGWGWIAKAWPLGIVGLLQIAYLRGQVIIPGAILDGHEAGQVVDGFNLYSVATLLPGALGLAAWPAISRAHAGSREAGLRLVTKLALANLAFVSLPVAALLLLPGTIAETVFGETSPAMETYVRWGAIGALFVAPNAVLFTAAVSMGRDRVAAGIWVVGLVAAASLTAAFTSEFGVSGAGFAVAASEVVLSALLLWCVLSAPGERRAASFFETRGGVVVAGVSAGALVGVAGSFATFPTPASGYLPLLGLPVLVALAFHATRYDLLAPAPVFAVSWTAALGLAQLPLYPTFGWNAEAWVLLTVPAAFLAVSAMASAGSSGFFAGVPLPGSLSRPLVGWLVVLGAAVAGAAGWGLFFWRIGSVPLLSNEIDIARFQAFGLPSLVGTRLGYVAVVAGIPGIALARNGRERALMVLAVAIAVFPMLLSGGRLYPFSAVVIGVLATVLIRGITLRVGVLGMAGAALLVAVSSAIFFVRIDQQSDVDNEFKRHLNEELRDTRPEVLHWTIPVQLAAAGSMYTLADLADSHAFEEDNAPGPYSTKFLDRLIPSGDLESVTRPTARFSLVTTTYVGPWYADFGLPGAVALSVVWGLAAGLLWRWWRKRPSPLAALLYAYSAFWLMYAIYLNYWTVHGVWIADVAFLVLLTAPWQSWAARGRGLAERYERPLAAGPGREYLGSAASYDSGTE